MYLTDYPQMELFILFDVFGHIIGVFDSIEKAEQARIEYELDTKTSTISKLDNIILNQRMI